MAQPINPYVAGKPVKGTEMFFGRADVFDFIRERLTGRYQDSVILLHGQPRTGKTSILYQMRRHVDEKYICVSVDLHAFALRGMDGFLTELANHIARSPLSDYQIMVPQLEPSRFASDARRAFGVGFLDDVSNAIGDRHLLLMLDEVGRIHEQVQAGLLERDVFGYMRHLAQHRKRVNFLLSLGNEYEEMRKEYGDLFRIGLRKTITFLDREATERLITEPVKHQYTVERAARDRILRLTACHPYYTQLLCQCLFSRCQRERLRRVVASDVDAVLDQVLELGAPNLQSIWQEASSIERALMAALAASVDHAVEPVTITKLRQLWAAQEIALSGPEIVRALESLATRQVITEDQPYRFTIDLHRLWLSRYRSLEWARQDSMARCVTRASNLRL
jgi:hypothetical protein